MTDQAAAILASAKADNLTRKAVKTACYAQKISGDDREAIYAELGLAPTSPAEIVAPAAATAGAKAAKPFGNMALLYAATDSLTGLALSATTRVLAVKIGGGWDFTAAAVSLRDFRKAIEARLFSAGNGDGTNDLDHQDYTLLADFGNEFPFFARTIACDVPGLAN